ncbi:MAG: triose-phosphate isomerase [Thermoflavifilum sp.]|nr:triose-phosphate isomerase [Thermoflavifilum sp.]
MRTTIVAGNWKMHGTLPEVQRLAKQLIDVIPAQESSPQIVICPPFLYLMMLRELFGDRASFHLGAQNCYTEPSGAYTGEIAAPMLASVGVEYVIIGHSERRQYFGESAEMLARKVDAALHAGIKPIFCCGEPLQVRQRGEQNAYVQQQLQESLFHLSAGQLQQVVIAYEPIWAIGTGVNATAQQAQDMHAFIRAVLAEHYGQQLAASITILYGGSVKASNAAELFACADVDGGLVGGASLKAEEFAQIIRACKLKSS